MKRLLTGVLVIAVLAAGVWYAFGGSDGSNTRFGGEVGSTITRIADIRENPERYLGQTVTVEGTLSKQCPTTGCWWYVRDEGGEVRADSKGAGFALPPNREGKPVRTTGKVIRTPSGDLEIASTGSELQ